MQALASQETGLVNCYSHYIQLESSIIQRLKWAAGANPSLNLVLQQFDDASSLRKLLYEVRGCFALSYSNVNKEGQFYTVVAFSMKQCLYYVMRMF